MLPCLMRANRELSGDFRMPRGEREPHVNDVKLVFARELDRLRRSGNHGDGAGCEG